MNLFLRQKVITRLKGIARDAYYECNRAPMLGCGNQLQEYMTRNKPATAAKKYDNAIARLKRIDPDFPKGGAADV